MPFLVGGFVDDFGLVNGANLLWYAGGGVGPAASLVLVPDSFNPMIYAGSLGLPASPIVIVAVLKRWPSSGPVPGLGGQA